MNREQFKLAHDTLRKAVREYGWARKADTDDKQAPKYLAPLGKFEGEHWRTVHYYDAVMNGFADEPLYDGERMAADILEVTDDERVAFRFGVDIAFVALWHSESGFVSMQELTAKDYDELRAQYETNEGEQS